VKKKNTTNEPFGLLQKTTRNKAEKRNLVGGALRAGTQGGSDKGGKWNRELKKTRVAMRVYRGEKERRNRDKAYSGIGAQPKRGTRKPRCEGGKRENRVIRRALKFIILMKNQVTFRCRRRKRRKGKPPVLNIGAKSGLRSKKKKKKRAETEKGRG